jgi:hypothetical protein
VSSWRAIGAPQPRRRRRAAPSRLRPGDAAVRRRLGGRSRPDRPYGGGSTWSRSSSFATASSGGTPAGSATRSGRRRGARSGGAHAGTAATGSDAGVGRRTLQAVPRRADRPAGQRRLASTSQVSDTVTGGPSWSWSCQVPTMVRVPSPHIPAARRAAERRGCRPPRPARPAGGRAAGRPPRPRGSGRCRCRPWNGPRTSRCSSRGAPGR